MNARIRTMKRDIDRLMEADGLDALIVTGKVHGNPPMKYLVGSAGVTNGVLVKKRGEMPILVHGTMEREEAQATGFDLMSFEDFGFMEIVKQGKGPQYSQKEFMKRIIDRLGLKGVVGLFGRVEYSRFSPIMEDLKREISGIDWARAGDKDIFTSSRVTKDRDEIEAIRSVGRRTGEVIQEVIETLRSAEKTDGTLVRPGGQGDPLTVGDIKEVIALSLAKRGLMEEDATIFSVGYDTAVPHNRGNAGDPITAGAPIIFDIFPADSTSGYHYDCTRSMVVGEPSEEFLRLYEDVKGACELAEIKLSEGASACGVNLAIIDYFEEKGHPTLKREGNFTDGYIHSLGHGIGLDVHEDPTFGLTASPNDRLEKGMVFTVEPGLYYPERSIGVRVEDVYWINEDGVGEKVVDIPYTIRI